MDASLIVTSIVTIIVTIRVTTFRRIILTDILSWVAGERPTRVLASQHSGAEACDYGAIRRQDGHPVVFTANGSDALPVTIAKRGIFDAASAGNLVFETLVSPTATLSASGDSLTLTDTISM